MSQVDKPLSQEIEYELQVAKAFDSKIEDTTNEFPPNKPDTPLLLENAFSTSILNGEHNEPILSNEPTTVCKLDALGPIIVNTDGTLSRIPNWNTLSDLEREKAMRLISKRNEKRKVDLLASEGL